MSDHRLVLSNSLRKDRHRAKLAGIACLKQNNFALKPNGDRTKRSEKPRQETRKFKRYSTYQVTRLIESSKSSVTYQLIDYSGGGLSFVSDRKFYVGTSLTIVLKDPLENDLSNLDFKFMVVRVGNQGQGFTVGCQIYYEIDQEIWQSLI